MGMFRDAEELYAVQGGFFDLITVDSSLGPKFAASDTSFLVKYTDPEAFILVDCTGDDNRVIYPASPDTDAEITLTMEADAGHRFWLGDLNLTGAIARRKVTIHGSMKDALRLLPAMKPAFPKYRTYCIENGHADKT